VLQPHFIGLEEARQVLAEMGVVLSVRQMQRAAELRPDGMRKFPFFIDPIEGTLKIDKRRLIEVYLRCQVEAERRCRFEP
jgi:hypothetical protein